MENVGSMPRRETSSMCLRVDDMVSKCDEA
jgi:hypothetical protein